MLETSEGVKSAFECHKTCQNTPECAHWSFIKSETLCLTLANCPNLVAEGEDSQSISGEKDCEIKRQDEL